MAAVVKAVPLARVVLVVEVTALTAIAQAALEPSIQVAAVAVVVFPLSVARVALAAPAS